MNRATLTNGLRFAPIRRFLTLGNHSYVSRVNNRHLGLAETRTRNLSTLRNDHPHPFAHLRERLTDLLSGAHSHHATSTHPRFVPMTRPVRRDRSVWTVNVSPRDGRGPSFSNHCAMTRTPITVGTRSRPCATPDACGAPHETAPQRRSSPRNCPWLAPPCGSRDRAGCTPEGRQGCVRDGSWLLFLRALVQERK